MKVSFVMIVDIYSKRENGFCLEIATMFQIQDMFENGTPDIVLKTVKRFNIKNSFYNFDLKKVYNWELLSSSINIGYSFYNRLLLWIWAGIPKTQSFNLCPFLTLSVRFETNVPCIRL